MKLLPSWREKRYYMLIKNSTGTDRFSRRFVTELINHINSFLGHINAAKAGVMYVKVRTKPKQKHNIIVLSVNRKFVNHTRAALTMLDSVHCVYVSGSLKKIKQKIATEFQE